MRALLLVVLSLAGACRTQSAAPPAPAGPAPAPAPAPAPGPSRDAIGHLARIERGLPPPVKIRGELHLYSLENRMRELKIRAVSIAVFESYTLQWAHTWGQAHAEVGLPATEDTVFLAGSISKSVNALAALLAAAEGTLALDAPINDHLTSWKLPENELTRAAPVTLRRLLSHTAGTTVHGFPGYVAGAPLPTVPQILDGTPPANTPAVRVDLAPGTQFRYSGGGTTIVQLALVDRTKRPYPELLRDRVLAPLGMTHSTFQQVPPPETAAVGYGRDGKAIPGKRHAYPEMAAAGLWTTAADLARFFAEVARARTGTSKLIPREVAMQMTTPVIEIGPGNSVGLGVFLRERNGTKLFGHGGSDAGFQGSAVASLDGGFGLVVMASSDNGFRIFDQIEDAVFDEYAWPGRSDPIDRVEADPRPFLGRYLLRGQPFTIAGGAKLQLRRPFEDPVELVPIDPSAVVALDDGTRYRLDPGGAALQTERQGRPGPAAKRLSNDERLPLLELEADRFDSAVAAWKAIEKERPKDPAVDEDSMNIRGYELLARGQTDAAALVLSLVAAAHPDSANAHDSLGEAYAAAGDKRRAIAAYEAAKARLAADKRIPVADKPRFARRVDEALAKLRGP
jgi:CubicO group peptidase (beta-lactamase class C family)